MDFTPGKHRKVTIFWLRIKNIIFSTIYNCLSYTNKLYGSELCIYVYIVCNVCIVQLTNEPSPPTLDLMGNSSYQTINSSTPTEPHSVESISFFYISQQHIHNQLTANYNIFAQIEFLFKRDVRLKSVGRH